MAEGLKWLAPGIYAGPDGSCHIDVRALLEAGGYEVNDENVATLEAAWQQKCAELGIPLEVVE